jgi:hypothetical protein
VIGDLAGEYRRTRKSSRVIRESVSDRGSVVRGTGEWSPAMGATNHRKRFEMEPVARRLYRLVEPIHLVTYFSDEPTDALMALGHRNYWDGYFAGRAAPLGRVPAEVVHAIFYNFADGEVSRHIPRVWDTASPEDALAARERGSVAALRRILGDLAGAPTLARAAELATKAATGAPTEGRVMYAALRALPVPEEPVARLWHAATLLREHRGTVTSQPWSPRASAGRRPMCCTPSPRASPRGSSAEFTTSPRLAAVVDGMRARGLIEASGWLSDAGRESKERIESLTDDLAAPAYDSLTPSELDQLMADLEPISAALDAAGSR